MKKVLLRWPVWLAVLGMLMLGACERKVAGETASYYFGNTPEAELARAAGDGKTDAVKRLVKAGADVNALGQKNMTPLIWALTARNIEGMRALLQAGADPNQSVGPELQFHPVWLAAGMDTPEPLRVLLDFKGNPNARHKGYEFNALMHAIMQLENVKLLVKAGADVNAADQTGEPVALSAASLAQYEVVIYLLEHGFRNNLPLLAWEVNDRPLSPDFEPKRQKALALLKSMGVLPPSGKAPARQPWISGAAEEKP
ncbi:ankyrin repeat domain-containing protein [Massilia sp. erpn]|uniref:ankyrin repeat domain-containing protein n=1 Tax=Massilia sp. erpn TaxID=2738142 RepID=UPI0021055F25|nr:ankyrin repeat domain-containing protein [Massilia sp. erpn]UTY56241.1 ankyrin repeat domain-containing protein [Massilia sp. erpn]